MPHRMSDQQRIEEMAEEIWSLTERGQNERALLLAGSKLGEQLAGQVLSEMERRGMAEIRGDRVILLPAGEAVARMVIRRHRLAEVLLGNVLAVGEKPGVSSSSPAPSTQRRGSRSWKHRETPPMRPATCCSRANER